MIKSYSINLKTIVEIVKLYVIKTNILLEGIYRIHLIYLKKTILIFLNFHLNRNVSLNKIKKKKNSCNWTLKLLFPFTYIAHLLGFWVENVNQNNDYSPTLDFFFFFEKKRKSLVHDHVTPLDFFFFFFYLKKKKNRK